MTKTPKTDAQAYDVLYRGDMGGWFRADEIKKDPDGDHVSADFARQLEEENTAMKNAITTAAELIDGLDLHLMGNYGMFVLAALEKLQPFLK